MDYEVNKCLDVVKQYCREGNVEKARKFLEKAKRLDPSIDIDKLFSEYSKLERTEKSSASFDTGEKVPESANLPTYTEGQVKDIEKAKKAKDFYELLGLSNDFKEPDLKKAYKKYALKFHPDKNKAPGASEIFKAVSRAYSTLSDAGKRAQYDSLRSVDKDIFKSNQPTATNANFRYQDDIDADELYRAFFGNQMGGAFIPFGGRVFIHRGNFFNRQHFRQREQPQRRQNFDILSLLPLIVFILAIIISWVAASDPVYMLNREGKYSIKRTTNNLGIFYFVKSDFDEKYKGRTLQTIEFDVERQYIDILREKCYYERGINYQASFGSFFNPTSSARRGQTPSCDELHRLRIRI